MGLIRKVASIMMLGGVSSHTRREPPGKAERARTKAERAREKAAQAQAVRAEAEAKVAEEQAAALARALHEDEAHRQADLREVAEKRPRPCRSGHQTCDSGMEAAGWCDEILDRAAAHSHRAGSVCPLDNGSPYGCR